MVSNEELNTWEICNNVLDIYRLRGFTTTSSMANLTFKDNTLNIHTWVDSSLVAGIEGSNIICENNIITCVNGKEFKGVRSVDFTNRVVFRNNVLKNCRYPLGAGKHNEFIVENNTIRDEQSDLAGRVSAYGEYKNIIGNNNNIYKDGAYNPFSGKILERADFTNNLTLTTSWATAP
jgi:hypothetical protein